MWQGAALPCLAVSGAFPAHPLLPPHAVRIPRPAPFLPLQRESYHEMSVVSDSLQFEPDLA